jgi:murein DD-endopeptidase MepM/ murein hydrolase activator NlpD
MGLWTGIEADGPSRGQAAVIPGGRVVGFVAEAGNLTPPDGVGVPGLFVHERVDPPLYQLAGRVLAEGGQPVADVVVAAGPHRATTDADGRFALPNLVGGTYTLAAAKAGYSFTPPRRTVSLLRDLPDQDFVAFAAGTPDAFLELPLADEGAPSLLWLLRDTDEGGWVDAWFDHDAPTYAKNGAVLLWDGQTRNQDAYHAGLGCYARRCYDGHDGIDFPYRDPDPGTPNVFEPLLVYPAAAGRVVAVTRGCVPGDRWCNRGYGNEVLLYHDNGYFTRYSHLATVAVADGPAWVTPELPLGEMGSTGNSFGTHLHFAAHRDNGNGVWDGDGVDLPVDPFGWAGVGVDPWVAQHGGPVSRWLWRLNPTTEAILLGSQGATLRDGAGGVTVNIPADALAGQVRVELVMGAAVSPPATGLRSLGRGFRVQVLDWLVDGSAANATPARPLEMSVSFAGAALRHVDMTQLFLYQRRDGQGWQPVPTVVDAEAQVALAATNLLGDFDLLAPLLCPADDLEPDDSFDAAAFVPAAGGIWARLFDVVEDEDWFQIEAAAGVTYAVTVDELAPGVAVSVAVYDQDGLTRLDGRRGAGTLTWTAANAGSYFVRVAAEPGSATGCDAGYRVRVGQ